MGVLNQEFHKHFFQIKSKLLLNKDQACKSITIENKNVNEVCTHNPTHHLQHTIDLLKRLIKSTKET